MKKIDTLAELAHAADGEVVFTSHIVERYTSELQWRCHIRGVQFFDRAGLLSEPSGTGVSLVRAAEGLISDIRGMHFRNSANTESIPVPVPKNLVVENYR